jgi:flavorubredoxin
MTKPLEKDKQKQKEDKFVRGFKNKKNQPPSYTDRVLFKNNTCRDHKFNKYDVIEMYGSDHRPIFLDVTVSIKPL